MTQHPAVRSPAMIMRNLARGLAAASLAAAALASPLLLAQASAADEPQLLLTVSGAHDSWVRGAVLACEPEPGGDHPHAADACTALKETDGNPTALAGDSQNCPRDYDPVTVSLNGEYGGRTMSWQKTYANECVMRADTGPVFDF